MNEDALFSVCQDVRIMNKLFRVSLEKSQQIQQHAANRKTCLWESVHASIINIVGL